MTASRGTSNHPVGEVRHGQLITSIGPGAMVDLPDRSVVVGGLNLWHYSRDDDSCYIDEQRLIAKLRGLLGVGTLLLKRPPSEDDNFAQKFRSSSGIRSPHFPLWFVAQPKEPFPGGGPDPGRQSAAGSRLPGPGAGALSTGAGYGPFPTRFHRS